MLMFGHVYVCIKEKKKEKSKNLRRIQICDIYMFLSRIYKILSEIIL